MLWLRLQLSSLGVRWIAGKSATPGRQAGGAEAEERGRAGDMGVMMEEGRAGEQHDGQQQASALAGPSLTEPPFTSQR